MRRLRLAWLRLRALVQRNRLDRELAAELESHLAHHIDDNLRAGMTPDAARRLALVKLGGVAQVAEQHRHVRGIPLVEHLLREARYSARALRARPAFTTVAVLTLGLGIGANTAIFSVINAALLRPLPVDRPGELVTINRLMLLARSTDLRRETAIRLAVGAGRADLVRRSLVESALLSLAGVVLALLLSQWLAAALTAWRPSTDLPLVTSIVIDHRVLAFSLALAALCTFLVGLIPALQGTRPDLVSALKEETSRWRVGWHARDLVVGAQVTLSTILLIGSLLVTRSLQHAAALDFGYNPRGAVSARVDLGLQGYDQPRAREFQRLAIEQIAARPGVESVAVTSALPLSMDVSTHGVYVEGRAEPRGSDSPQVIYYQVSPGFFRTIQMRLVAGRDFAATDTRETPRVAVVNQAFAMKMLGGVEAIGRRFRTGRSGPWTEIIGVVQDGKYRTLSEEPAPAAFYSGAQWYNPTTSVVVRSSLSDGEALELVRRVVRHIDSSLSLFEEGPLSDVVALQLTPARVAASLLGAFGALAIVLVLVGTYGVMSYGIVQRTHEICIRLAVGASPSHIVRLVLGRASVVWALGVGVGAAAAIVGSPLLSPFLIGVKPRDPALIGLACATIALVTAAACWLPTRRAIATDPSVLMRRS